jgi:hypothetical protein
VRWKRESADDVEHTEIQAIHDRRGQDEDLPPARPVREFPADEGSGDDDADWVSVPRNICCGTSALAVPILSSR